MWRRTRMSDARRAVVLYGPSAAKCTALRGTGMPSEDVVTGRQMVHGS